MVDKKHYLFYKKKFLVVFVLMLSLTAGAQVTKIYTDYNGFWMSGIGQINSLRPDNNHNVLAFTYRNGANETTYSTGVNDQLLVQYGVPFSANIYQALPVLNIPFPTGGTSIYAQFGEMQDGLHASTTNTTVQFPYPYSAANMPTLADLFTDGIYGLDISTGITNIPNTIQMEFQFTTIENIDEINDGKPDFLITQIALPDASKFDKIWFTDENNNLVGKVVDIEQNSVDILAYTQNDLFEGNGKASKQINEEKPIRLVALEASAFDLHVGNNYSRAKKLKYQLGGSSDVAFLAFNYKLLEIVVANHDKVTTQVNTPVTINVLQNDLIPTAVVLNPITIVSGSGPANGSAIVNSGNTITYTPNNGFIGIDTFRYKVCSTTGSCDEAIVTIIVGSSDISVTKTLNSMRPAIGNTVVFTVTVKNNGPHNALGTSVLDLLPAGYTYTSHTVSTGSYSSNSGNWFIGNLANGASQTLTINAVLKSIGPYTNVATAKSYMYDENLENNRAEVTPLSMPSARITVDCQANQLLQVVNVHLTGEPGWSINYTHNGINYTQSNITSSPHVLTPNKSGMFYITSVTDSKGTKVTYPSAPPFYDLNVRKMVSKCFSITNPAIRQNVK